MKLFTFICVVFGIIQSIDQECLDCKTIQKNCENCEILAKLASDCVKACPSGYDLKNNECLLTENKLIDSKFFEGLVEELTEIWSIPVYKSISSPIAILYNRGLFLNDEIILDSIKTYSLSLEFSLSIWIKILTEGFIIKSSYFQISSSSKELKLTLSSQSTLNCKDQPIQLKSETPQNWLQINLFINSNSNQLSILFNEKHSTYDELFFHYPHSYPSWRFKIPNLTSIPTQLIPYSLRPYPRSPLPSHILFPRLSSNLIILS